MFSQPVHEIVIMIGSFFTRQVNYVLGDGGRAWLGGLPNSPKYFWHKLRHVQCPIVQFRPLTLSFHTCYKHSSHMRAGCPYHSVASSNSLTCYFSVGPTHPLANTGLTHPSVSLSVSTDRSVTMELVNAILLRGMINLNWVRISG